MGWATLFDRAPTDVTVEQITTTLRTHREERPDDAGSEEAPPLAADEPDPSPARVVADADVLAADLLVGGASRRALDCLWTNSWTTLVASDALLDDAERLVAACADEALTADWRALVDAWREPAVHPAGDHPALASAYRGGAMHVLSLDDRLTSAAAGSTLSGRFSVSVREPAAFAFLFTPESLYTEVADGDYPGPDREPRERAGN
ncbi:DUF7384 family protein [Haloferacaceae archaeon DSL9]